MNWINISYILLIVADIVVLVVGMAGEDKADAVGREVLLGSPDARRDVDAAGGAVEQKGATFRTVVQDNLEAASNGDEELVALLMGMCATVFAGGHIVGVEDTADVEGHLCKGVQKSKTAARINDARQLRYLYFRKVFHSVTFSCRRGREA